jgi:hypothetical protein
MKAYLKKKRPQKKISMLANNHQYIHMDIHAHTCSEVSESDIDNAISAIAQGESSVSYTTFKDIAMELRSCSDREDPATDSSLPMSVQPESQTGPGIQRGGPELDSYGDNEQLEETILRGTDPTGQSTDVRAIVENLEAITRYSAHVENSALDAWEGSLANNHSYINVDLSTTGVAHEVVESSTPSDDRYNIGTHSHEADDYALTARHTEYISQPQGNVDVSQLPYLEALELQRALEAKSTYSLQDSQNMSDDISLNLEIARTAYEMPNRDENLGLQGDVYAIEDTEPTSLPVFTGSAEPVSRDRGDPYARSLQDDVVTQEEISAAAIMASTEISRQETEKFGATTEIAEEAEKLINERLTSGQAPVASEENELLRDSRQLLMLVGHVYARLKVRKRCVCTRIFACFLGTFVRV